MSQCKYVFLSGAMEFAPDGGVGWRQLVEEFCAQELELAVYNPCVRELEVMTQEEQDHYKSWKTTDLTRHMQVVEKIKRHDVEHLLNQSKFVIVYWCEHTRGAGTGGEVTLAWEHSIPVFMVSNLPLNQISSWALSCTSKHFTSFKELFSFLTWMKNSLSIHYGDDWTNQFDTIIGTRT